MKKKIIALLFVSVMIFGGTSGANACPGGQVSPPILFCNCNQLGTTSSDNGFCTRDEE